MNAFQTIAVFLLALSFASLPKSAFAQACMALIIPDEDRIVDTDEDVFIVTVSQVSDHTATRENPPRVVFNIDRTVRGTAQKTIRANWEVPYDPEYYRLPPVPPPLTEAQKRQAREYANEALANPETGSKWVVVGFFWSKSEGSKDFAITAKFPLSKERRVWVDSQLNLRRQYAAERNQHRQHWPPRVSFFKDELPAGARPITAETALRPGTPVLVRYATTTQCCVIDVLDNGRVKVRPHGHDSRHDAVLPREKLMLYPEKFLDSKKAIQSKAGAR